MPSILAVDEEYMVGEAWFSSTSPRHDWAVVFEDDGETAYFYASRWNPGSPGTFGAMLDAMHIYNVGQVTDREKPCRLRIAWNSNGSAAMLVINTMAHAVFDMDRKQSCCRTGFPPPGPESPFVRSHAWENALAEQFR